MEDQLNAFFDELKSVGDTEHTSSALNLLMYLALGGLLALYVRFIYRRFNDPRSEDTVSIIFPLLTIVTVGVIATIKSSLALSLGMVGALSIVRFRTAIRKPQELVYLFLCIAIGLALGAEFVFLAVILVAISTLCAIWMGRQQDPVADELVLLTVTDEAIEPLIDHETGVVATVSKLVGDFSVSRIDSQQGNSQIRLELRGIQLEDASDLIQQLRQIFPLARIKIQ
ncbi:MAG TPA: DUF4956 domain-containing protein [Verrucomicrobia bacterium]|nr:DUF4956 domain-containing protein [Verrucomicrobiota bacterium]